ncbi:SMC family ATPase [Candidatus Woesearchaeota archaeon]|nr:SMC family ATPase [Candidatus Woesearchaeota archaeon]
MRLKRVRLQNIRSYIESEMVFPDGSVLLSGNIGSGKTTILLALEFALFGLMKGNLSGSGLLRNGADSGTVDVTFSLGKEDVRICRNLKRTASSVVQDAGFIEVNGVRKEATAVEIKQRVLELLHYPRELLTKNKALIYRYTVYTPQEEMKYILQCDPAERLEILRKVFGIDKYKRIVDNTKILAQAVKEKKKEVLASVADLPSLQTQLENSRKELAPLHEMILQASQRLEQAKGMAESALEAVSQLEAQTSAMREARRNAEMVSMLLEDKRRRELKLEHEKAEIGKAISLLQEELAGFTNTSLRERILEEKKELGKVEEELQRIMLEIHSLQLKKEHAEHVMQKISALNTCPMCLQNVEAGHKSALVQGEQEKIVDAEKKKEEIQYKQREIQHLLTQKKGAIELLLQEESMLEAKRVKIRGLREKEEHFLHLEKESLQIRGESKLLENKKEELGKQAQDTAPMEALLEEKKRILLHLQKEEREAYLLRAEMELKKKSLERECAQTQQRIEEKETLRKKQDYLQQLQFWLEEHFITLMQNMEKSIMLKVHADFNSFFQKWFSMLVEKDVIAAALDESFTPRIQQNGYETEFDFLSGGEKTAACLAYRLALNQVINAMAGVIATKDLIILDEPTDGFSSEQLDRLRNVLEEINIGQIILVSHEPKIESFVQHVIRFDKKEHVSSVL